VLVEEIADSGTTRQTGGRIRLAALHADVQVAEVAIGALQLGCPLHEFLRAIGRISDRLNISAALDRETFDWLAGFGDAIDNVLGPAGLDADHDHSGNIRVAANTDHRSEEQLKVFAELQATVAVRKSHRALHVVGHAFARGIRNVIDRKNYNM